MFLRDTLLKRLAAELKHPHTSEQARRQIEARLSYIAMCERFTDQQANKRDETKDTIVSSRIRI